jgi:hypothetical protein
MHITDRTRRPIDRAIPWLCVALAGTLAACGGGSATPTAPASSQVATFIDAHVEGLAFRSASHSGLTDQNGNFLYVPGETVSFSIGNMVLGSVAPTGNKVTPVQLVPGASDANDPRVTRILRTLQSLDTDDDLGNGIQISAWAREVASSRPTVRLDDGKTTDEEVEGRLSTGQYTRTEEEARSHYRDHKDDESNEKKGYDGSGSGTDNPVAQPVNTSGRLLASNCFQCHGTLGRGGFDSIRGGDAEEVLDYLSKPASSDIMAAHAQGYTRAQLQLIVSYLKQ